MTSTSDCVTGQGDDSWQLTLSQTRTLTVTVQDLYCPGDYYEVRVDGALIGTTFKPAAWGCSSSGTLSSGSFSISLCPGTHLITVRDAGFDGHSQAEIEEQGMCPAGFNVAGALASIMAAAAATCPALQIVQPSAGDDFPLNNQDLTATTATFKAQGPDVQVNWTLHLDYSTSGGLGGYSISLSGFSTPSGTSLDQTFTAEGGQITAMASATVGTSTMTAMPVAFTVTGAAVPNSLITSQLVSLYSTGATPHLLTGIAMVESSYRQFGDNTLYGQEALWPLEPGDPDDGGTHIGLMMVPITSGLADAWSWKANAAAGLSVFQQKLAIAMSRAQQMMTGKPGLRTLTSLEIENMAIFLYRGPSGAGSLSKQYYIPVRTGGGWNWALNPKANPVGVAYVQMVRNDIQ
jgi:hypothetical protein